jgi:CubicO group peptidase (beta-lactamase class C family)
MMKKIIFFLLFPAVLNAQNNNSVFDAYLKAQTDLYNFNGNVVIAKNRNIFYQKSFSYADYNTKQKLDSASIFDIGSIAKKFTAAGILLLKDKEKISYTDTPGKFFPELLYSNITEQQFLTHTSGIPDGFGLIEKFFYHNKIDQNSDLIKLLEKEKPPLLFKPGIDRMYSGTAFNVRAFIIEKISGQTYNTYMDEKFFKPLGMKYTEVASTCFL